MATSKLISPAKAHTAKNGVPRPMTKAHSQEWLCQGGRVDDAVQQALDDEREGRVRPL